MKTLEQTTTLADNEPTVPEKSTGIFDDIIAQMPDVEAAGRKIIEEDTTRAHFAEILSHETLIADDAKDVESEQAVEKKPTLRQRVGRKLGNFASRVNTSLMLASSGAIEGIGKVGRAYKKPLEKMAKQEDDTRLTRAKKFLGRSAYRTTVAAGLLTAAVFTRNAGEGIAEAANITVNGHGGGASNAFNDVIANSTLGRNEKTAPVHWSAEMGDLPFFPSEKLSTVESTTEGAQRIGEVVGQNPGNNTLIGYSEGSIAVAKYLKDNPDYIANGNSVILVGNPYIPGQELRDNPLYKMVAPLVPDTTKTLEYELPGGENVLYISNEDDPVWLKGNNPVGILAGVLDRDAHAYSSADISGQTPHVTVHNADGSTTRMLTETKTVLPGTDQNAKSGISAGLVQRGMYVSPAGDNFFEALDGEPTNGKWNAAEVIQTGAVAAEEALPGSGAVIENIFSTPGVTEIAQQAADTYLDTQNQVFDQVATVVQQNPEAFQPVVQLVEQATPQVLQAAEAVQNVAPQFAPQVNQAKDMLGQIGIKLG